MLPIQLLQPAAVLLLSGADNALSGSAVSSSSASGTLTTGISLVGQAVATALAAGTLTAGDTALIGSAVSTTSAQGTLSTGIALTGHAVSTTSASGTLPVTTTTLDADFAGANANTSLSVITDPNSDTPTITIRVRTPDDSEWQQWLFKLNGVRNKTLTIEILLTEKEDSPDAYLGTWEGPWWSTDNTAGPSGWTNEPGWSQVSGDRMTFTITPGAVDSIYVASLPPWTQDTVAAWINELADDHPTLIHDDLPSRVALGGAAYVCALSGSGVDENGRSITNLPLRGFRIGNDSLGVFPKRRIILFSGVHSLEWNGGLQLRGFVRELLTGIHSTELLTKFDFYIYPLHSIKGNYLGFRRNEAAASYVNNNDANREWADGDTTLATVVQWQGILDVDHGVNHRDKVVGFFDFHDGKNVSDKAWFYYFTSQTGFAEFEDVANDENAEINAVSSAISDGTTSQYFMGKNINFAWTCEVADERSTVAQIEDIGEAYARALKVADDQHQLPRFHPCQGSAVATSSASGVLATAIMLTGVAQAASNASGVLTTAIRLVGHAESGSTASGTLSEATITLPPIYNYNRAPIANQTLDYIVLDPATATVVASGTLTTDEDGNAPPITGSFTIGVAYDVVLRSATVEPGAARLLAA
jgi:hypothetical protein